LPPRITVQFDLDMNGILNVSAVDRGSGQATQTTLRAAHTRLSPNDRAAASQRIDELWQTGAAVSGDPLLQRAKAWVQGEEEQVHELADLVQRLEAAERDGDLEAAARWREELTDLLYDLEDTASDSDEDDDEADTEIDDNEWDE
jgi:molecular chaperone DnaK (HSP70)